MEKLTNVLYVEDDTDIQEIVKLTLEHLGGMHIKICNSGRNALAELEKYQPQLILLDAMMPEANGMETLQTLKATPETRNIPVVFLTANVQKHEVDSYLAHGALGVVQKPFNPNKLVETLNTLWIEYHQA